MGGFHSELRDVGFHSELRDGFLPNPVQYSHNWVWEKPTVESLRVCELGNSREFERDTQSELRRPQEPSNPGAQELRSPRAQLRSPRAQCGK